MIVSYIRYSRFHIRFRYRCQNPKNLAPKWSKQRENPIKHPSPFRLNYKLRYITIAYIFF